MRILRLMSIIIINFLSIYPLDIRSIYADEHFISKIFELLQQEKWQECILMTSTVNNTVLSKIIKTQMMISGIYETDDGFAETIDFIKQNPHWPRVQDLKISAEKSITSATSHKKILQWFKEHTPTTAHGMKYHALAAMSIIKDETILKPIVKKGWVYGYFTKAEQRQYLQKAGKYLNHQDHINKIDLHITEGKITNAKQVYPLVKAAYRKSFDLQIALMQNKNVPQNIKKFRHLSKDLHTAGLIHQYLKARKNDTLPNAKDIVALSKKAAGQNKDFADHFWKLQAYYAREYIQRKRFKDAYAISSTHFTNVTKSRLNYYEAEFLSGWLATSFLKKHNIALEHFKNVNRSAKTPISKARGLYWMARAYQNIKNTEKARALYKQAAENYGHTFYGQVAAGILGMDNITISSNVLLGNDSSSMSDRNQEMLEAIEILSKYGSYLLSVRYIISAIDKASNSDHILLILSIVNKNYNLHHKTLIAKRAMQNNLFIKEILYPTPYKISHLPIEAALIYSIIKQESVFDQNAVSHADARGLMQLIRASACDTANNIGLDCTISRLTSDAHYNMTLGSHYLKAMLDLYNGSYILAIAAYNAGSDRADKWINLYGDPRKMKNINEIIDWIELIPYHETRNYVQRVLEGVQVYRTILNNSNRLYIKHDLLNKSRNLVKVRGV